MMSILRKLPYIFLLVAAVSCRQQTSVQQDTIEFVKSIMGNKDMEESHILAGLGRQQSSGAIAVVGQPRTCSRLAGEFSGYDSHDNVDASLKSDGIPDFSGETMILSVDSLGVSYRDYIDNGAANDLRELVVRHAVASLDTICHVSRYDVEGVGRKPSAKLLVLADVYLERYGAFDVDTLFRSSDVTVPIITPVDAMLDIALADKPRTLNVGVVCSSEYEGSDVYDDLIVRKAQKRGVADVQCHTFSTDSTGSLFSYLDRYIESGGVKALDLLFIDDAGIAKDTVMSDIAKIRDVTCPESLLYGKLVGQNMNVLESSECILEKCYTSLRGENMFSHKIAYPIPLTYLTAENPAEDGCLILIPANVQN